MILVVDAGNTRIKWALQAADGTRVTGALPTAEALRLGAAMPAGVEIDAVFACSVAGETVEASLAIALGAHAKKLRWCRSGAAIECGVRNHYRNPLQLGADRWAALIGAWALTNSDCLVVNAGTATTIDLLCAKGDGTADFVGGVILPGLDMMRSSLARNTAGLPHADGAWVTLPRHTDDAIETGCIEAQLGAIERMARRLPPATICLLSGGAAAALAGRSGLPERRIENLVLEGLLRIGAENLPQRAPENSDRNSAENRC